MVTFRTLRGKGARRPTHHEALQGPVVRVQQEAGHGAHLRGPVPAVGAVHKHTRPFLCDCLENRVSRAHRAWP